MCQFCPGFCAPCLMLQVRSVVRRLGFDGCMPSHSQMIMFLILVVSAISMWGDSGKLAAYATVYQCRISINYIRMILYIVCVALFYDESVF